MAALLFQAQLVSQTGIVEAQLNRILFGVDSPEEKERTFRTICQTKYPHLTIQEPVNVSPSKSAFPQ